MPEGERSRRAARRPPRRRGSQLLVAALVAVLAFAVTVQVRQDDTTDYGSLRGVELIELLKSVDVANERLASQIDDLTATRDRLRAARGDTGEAEDVARQRAEQLAVLAGSVGATGPGVRLTIDDPSGVVDAGLVLDVLQELREAGAEAIVVDDTARVVAQTYVLDDADGLRIGGRQVSSPYVIDVIGDPATLEEAVTFRGGVVDLLQARGAKAAVARRETITITALADVRTPEYARPDVGDS
jgi:uncharacterized protein YlxW (UPF0749 family)